MKTHRKLISLLLVIALMGALLAGCAGEPAEESQAPESETSAAPSESAAPQSEPAESAEAPDEEPQEPAEEIEAPEPTVESSTSGEIIRNYTQAEQMPLTEDNITLTAWDYVVPPVMSVISDYGVDGLVYQTLQERTGVKMEFNTANLLTASSNMALMVAANELPDIIFNFGMFYSGSMDDLIEGEIIIDYADHEDVMPNYFDIIRSNPDIARDIYTEEGYVALACNIQKVNYVNSGGAIRNEWLVENGLEKPETLADYENILTVFQAENDCAHPFWLASNGGSGLISSAFNISIEGGNNSLAGWMYVDGEMQFCPPMEGFKSYIETIATWYDKGFISPDFFSQTYSGSADNEFITANRCGIWSTSVNGITNLSGVEPDCDVQPIQRAVMNPGDPVCFDDAGTSRISKGGAAVAYSNPEIELACRIIDYCYSEEGILLQNYGVEGLSFEYGEDGNPRLTELVTDNPDMAFPMALIKYTSSTPCSISDSSRNFLGYTQAQMDSLEVWKATGEIPMAPGAVWNTDDQTEYTNLYADMASYCSTECLKFITGEQPLTEWDRFITELTTLFDIERMQELNQAAVDNYINKYLG